jgi:uncharacterized membrane protein
MMAILWLSLFSFILLIGLTLLAELWFYEQEQQF